MLPQRTEFCSAEKPRRCALNEYNHVESTSSASMLRKTRTSAPHFFIVKLVTYNFRANNLPKSSAYFSSLTSYSTSSALPLLKLPDDEEAPALPASAPAAASGPG